MNKKYVIFLLAVAALFTGWMLVENAKKAPSPTPSADHSSTAPQQKTDPAREISHVPPSKTGLATIRTEQDFRARFKGDWQFLRHSEKIHSIMGGEVSGFNNSPEGATQFAKEVAGLFGVDPEQLDVNRISSIESGLRQAYHIGQSSEGVPVYQGEVAVFYTKHDGLISMLNSELQSFDMKVDGPKLSARQVTNSIESLSDWENVHVEHVQGVVLYVRNRVAIPSYVLTAVAGEPQETWEVVVNGVTGEVLHKHARNIDEDRKH